MPNFRAAFSSLFEQRQRALLSATGIAVASIAILLLISIALGVRADITKQIEDLGVNTVIVMPARIVPGQFNPNIGGQSYLKEEFAEQIKQIPGVRRTAPLSFAGGGIRFGEKEAFPAIIAVGANWFRMHPVKLKTGSFFTDPKSTEPVAVVGSVAAEEIFKGAGAGVGSMVQINQQQYRVIGITEDRTSEQSLFSIAGFQNVVYIPFHAAKAQNPNQQIDRIMVESAPDSEPTQLVGRIEAYLGDRLDRQQFSVLTQKDLLKLVYKLMGILTWLLTGLTSVALFVGGVGIMTVMLMAVNERSKEIGIRKAVGARRSDVFKQFALESIFLGLTGGLAGLVFSWAVCTWLDRNTDIHPLLTSGVIGLSFAMSIGVGALFGVIPALNAARKDPVEALRNE